MNRTYGALGWAKNPADGLSWWAMQVEPHVAIKAKRLFPRIEQGRTDMLRMLDTPEVAADLVWFMERYPLDMADDVRARVHAEAKKHEAYMEAIEGLLEGRRTLDDFPPPARAPREYQQIGADLAHLTGGLLLGDEVGLGKTQTALMLLRDPTTLPALIVTPTHLPRQWLRELHEVMPHLKGHIINSGSPTVTRQRNRRKVKMSYLTATNSADSDVFIASYSKLAGWREMLAGKIKTVIFDEVQELRHSGSDKYLAASRIADGADRRMGLSATPIYNYGGEAFNIFEVLKPGSLGTRTEFFREWGGSTRPNGDVVVKDTAGLGTYLREQVLLLRRTRHEVGRELPSGKPASVTIEVESGSENTDAVMEDVLRLAERVLHGDDHRERFVASGEMDMRLRQATGIDKAPQVATFVRMLLESEEKVVLFGWHRAVYDIWNAALREFQPTMYTGSESPSQKDASARRFIEDPACRVLICSLRSGAGLDGLQKVASVAVFGELDWSPAMHHQALGRLARDGQENETVGYFLVSEVGSDPVIADVLEAKAQQAENFMSPDDGVLFTAVQDDGSRAKNLARTLLAKAGRRVD